MVCVRRNQEHRRFEERIQRLVLAVEAHAAIGGFAILDVSVIANRSQKLVAFELLQPVILQKRAVEKQVGTDQRMGGQARIQRAAPAERRFGEHADVTGRLVFLLPHAIELHAGNLCR